MTLLNGLLALGALAFTIPLAIHLLFRSRFKTVQWGAMHLLDAVVRTNQRRLQLTELLLLLVRCAIPVLLALALARPLLTGFRALPGDTATSVVIAIDDSRSMNSTDESGQTAMQRGIAAMKEYVGGLSRRDEVMLIRSSELGLPVSMMGRDDALREISEITPVASAARLDALVQSSATALAESAHAQRRVMLVTDLRASDVTDAVIDGLAAQSRILSAMEPAAAIAVLDVGEQNDSTDNLFVEAIVADSQVAVKGREVRLVARIRNDTERFGNDVAVTWWVDGLQVESQRIAVQPRTGTAARLTHSFEVSGVHDVRVTIEWPDSLLADNQRQFAIRVIERVQVLIVDGEPSGEPLQSESDFLAIALSPFGFGGSTLPDSVQSRTIPGDQGDPGQRIDAALQESTADIIILAGVKQLSDSLRSQLAGFVERGGSLVVFDGDQLASDDYNAPWLTKDASYELPAMLGSVLGNAKQRESARVSKARINAQYAPWSSVLPQPTMALDDVEIYAFRELTTRGDDDENDSAANRQQPPRDSERMTLLETSEGRPLGLSTRWGRGRVVQFAIPADGDWTTLPLRGVFLPLLQQLMIDLAGNMETPNVLVGETIRVPISELGQPAEVNVAASYTVEPPLQKERPIQPSLVVGQAGAAQLVENTASGVGVYKFREWTKDGAGEAVMRTTRRVAEIDAIESQLRAAGSARTSAFATRLGASLHTDIDSLVNAETVNRYGREIWRWLLALLLLAMVLELFLQQRRLIRPRTLPAVRTMVPSS